MMGAGDAPDRGHAAGAALTDGAVIHCAAYRFNPCTVRLSWCFILSLTNLCRAACKVRLFGSMIAGRWMRRVRKRRRKVRIRKMRRERVVEPRRSNGEAEEDESISSSMSSVSQSSLKTSSAVGLEAIASTCDQYTSR